MTRLISTRPARKLAALLSLLMILLGGPTGGAFALCLGGDGHIAIEAVQAAHDHGAVPGVAADHSAISADCVDIPLVQASPAIAKKQLLAGLDIALPAASAAWSAPFTAEAALTVVPAAEPSLDPRLVSHRTVVLLN
ncbi:conserved exported protein of unknown function [Magnetospirillum sp. XM-1]|uniref:hypothetical protein n=1 Tax=Magnetospirillum sp. XM-1 TaxID=1663591 RepID=UPI00073DF348|nr:hypothetical protein [Magnetospirillum sp. XM-1]CUW39581.1 conserved exported protein of unknown function [Magnetospirillum sp. XM-1]